MKKFLIALVAVLGFASLSHAQGFTIRLGPTVILGGGGSVIGVEAELNARNLTRFSTDLSLGVYGGASVYFAGGSVVSINAGPTINFRFSGGQGNAFAGLVLGLAFGGGGSAFDLGFVTGVDYLVTSNINLFARISTGFLNGFGGQFAVGSDFEFSNSLAAYLKLGTGFGGGGVVIGGGLKFAL